MAFDPDQHIAELGVGEESEGNLHKQYAEDKLMHSLLAGDKQTIEHAELIQEATNRGIGAFTPDMIFASMTKNFSLAQQLFGEKLLRLLSGYDPRYIEKNLKIPEFRKELQRSIQEHIEQLKDDKLIDSDGTITATGAELSSLVLVHELDKYVVKDRIGEKINKKTQQYGERADYRNYRSGDRYKDLNIKRSITRAIKRSHTTLAKTDLITSQREGKGKVSLILALDASASMKGKKIETCKKAGIALAYHAIQEKDDIGLVVFGSEVKESIPPTRDFSQLLKMISAIKANKQTDFSAMIMKSIELFPHSSETKHLIIVTDALPTVGKEPERDTLLAINSARGAGITVSLIGIHLDSAGHTLAQHITRLGQGRFSVVKDLDQLGHFMLQDYDAIR